MSHIDVSLSHIDVSLSHIHVSLSHIHVSLSHIHVSVSHILVSVSHIHAYSSLVKLVLSMNLLTSPQVCLFFFLLTDCPFDFYGPNVIQWPTVEHLTCSQNVALLRQVSGVAK